MFATVFQYALGIGLIVFGVIIGLMAMFAAGMASRQTTRWERASRPLIWFAIQTLLGIGILSI